MPKEDVARDLPQRICAMTRTLKWLLPGSSASVAARSQGSPQTRLERLRMEMGQKGTWTAREELLKLLGAGAAERSKDLVNEAGRVSTK